MSVYRGIVPKSKFYSIRYSPFLPILSINSYQRGSLQSFHSILPITRLAIQLCNSDDQNILIDDLVDQSVRKTCCEASPGIFRQFRPGMWKLGNSVDRRIYFSRKIQAETCPTFFVICDRFEKFDPRRCVKRIIHPPKRFRTSSKTSSPGIGVTAPERTSSTRRWASIFHSSSISF